MLNAVSALSAAPLNHLLRQAEWARELLREHAGKVVMFRTPPFENRLRVLDNGEVGPAPEDAEADVTFDITPGVALRLGAGDTAAWRDIRTAGDTAFAAAIHHLWLHLRWDAEDDLSKIVGDIAAHRLVESGRALQQWALATGQDLARSTAEYLTEENPAVAHAYEIAQFNTDVDRLRDDVERLEKRIEGLRNAA